MFESITSTQVCHPSLMLAPIDALTFSIGGHFLHLPHVRSAIQVLRANAQCLHKCAIRAEGSHRWSNSLFASVGTVAD